MPDVRQILRSQAKQRGVRLDILEKDYALNYLLAAISETPPLSPLVLKGGDGAQKSLLLRLSLF